MNPPCYNCTSETPLQTGALGLCPKCAVEVGERSKCPSSDPSCSRCGWTFYNDWERIQHLVYQRHNYQAWTDEDGARVAERNGRAA